jgi:broad specificity phosphatase PhoE
VPHRSRELGEPAPERHEKAICRRYVASVVRAVLAIARHGEYEQPPGVPSAHLAHPLTREGRAQARELGVQIAELAAAQRWVVHGIVESSPLLRAYETATIACDALERATHAPHRVAEHAALAERSLGAAANLSVAEVDRLLALDARCAGSPGDWKTRADYRLPWLGAESLREAGERSAAYLRTLAARLRRGSRDAIQLVVGHGAAFRHAACALGLIAAERVAQLSMDHCRPILLDWDGSAFRQVGGEWKERGAGDRALD